MGAVPEDVLGPDSPFAEVGRGEGALQLQGQSIHRNLEDAPIAQVGFGPACHGECFGQEVAVDHLGAGGELALRRPLAAVFQVGNDHPGACQRLFLAPLGSDLLCCLLLSRPALRGHAVDQQDGNMQQEHQQPQQAGAP